jgi:predicted esterase
MDTRRRVVQSGLLIMAFLGLLLELAGCAPGQTTVLTQITVPPTIKPTPLPILSLDQTYVKAMAPSDFDLLHSPVNSDTNQYLIFGNLPISKPAANLPYELAVFLGRWEGYSHAPPVKKDPRTVLVIQEITPQRGKAAGWGGANLQYPDTVGEINFRVVPGEVPAIQFQVFLPDGTNEIYTFTYDRAKDHLTAYFNFPATNSNYGPFELTRDKSFYVYKDYAQYLAGKHIYTKTYQNSDLKHYGQGYMLYLPEGYSTQPKKTWPLIFFLHGYGTRGENILLLAKASPFMFIREKGPLPFIIAAPLLNTFEGYLSFPEAYMEGVLAEIQANYQVDAKRIYVTGLSMGGEATYRLAVHQPKMFAAIAPLSAYVDSETYPMIEQIRDLQVWAIHGADDIVIPLIYGKQPVDALKAAGGNVKFTVLADHDHDTWTDTYSDPAFYEWFLQYQRP